MTSEENDGGSMNDREEYVRAARTCLAELQTQEEAVAAETAKTAVHWLILASKEGDEAATQLLRDCVEKNIGK